jgi:hypothetical protein
LENTAWPIVTVALGAIIEPRTDMLSAMCLNSADRSSAARLSRGRAALGGKPNDVAKEWLKANTGAVTPRIDFVTSFKGDDAAAAVKAALAG